MLAALGLSHTVRCVRKSPCRISHGKDSFLGLFFYSPLLVLRDGLMGDTIDCMAARAGIQILIEK